MTYYDDLISDKKRVNSFKKVIEEKSQGITYDLGTGSGILAQFASTKADKIYAIENNPLIIKKTRNNLSNYSNVKFIEADATEYEFKELADVIICEMLDTALIDEEQVPVLNNAIKYAKNNTIFIPESIHNTIQLISTNIANVTYYEDNVPEFSVISDEITYQSVIFSQENDENFEKSILIKTKEDAIINAVKITTYTHLTNDYIIEPTPMLNPPLLIPVDTLKVKKDEEVIIKLKYIMGGGLNSIQASLRRNH